eukprot:comp22350_c0_seq1/m.53883 comp22350_c0_seq1/g.53883  ORF comp22350_c0_seq1/g.53883 comp22350_c0_seq1/m.53883 type:complete len:326 (+) comp22350_c0_seq1:234-1211(+)
MRLAVVVGGDSRHLRRCGAVLRSQHALSGAEGRGRGRRSRRHRGRGLWARWRMRHKPRGGRRLLFCCWLFVFRLLHGFQHVVPVVPCTFKRVVLGHRCRLGARSRNDGGADHIVDDRRRTRAHGGIGPRLRCCDRSAGPTADAQQWRHGRARRGDSAVVVQIVRVDISFAAKGMTVFVFGVVVVVLVEIRQPGHVFVERIGKISAFCRVVLAILIVVVVVGVVLVVIDEMMMIERRWSIVRVCAGCGLEVEIVRCVLQAACAALMHCCNCGACGAEHDCFCNEQCVVQTLFDEILVVLRCFIHSELPQGVFLAVFEQCQVSVDAV